jgi:integrase
MGILMTLSKSVVKRLQTQSSAPIFSEQANRWLADGRTRRRNPFRPKTSQTYMSQIETHLEPLIGSIPVDLIGNNAVKDVATKLSEKGLSPATIDLNINIIKQIRASALDQEGAQVYPYTWNADFIDAPIVDKSRQKRPIVSVQAVQDAISKADRRTACLIVLLASTGLRINEALALKIAPGSENEWLPVESRIIVRGQRSEQGFVPTKTKAGIREIDIPPTANDYLKRFVIISAAGDMTMFPLTEDAYRVSMKKAGLIGGFHSLRRFRITHLQLQGVPLSLIHFWVGHEDSTVTGRYTEIGPEIEARKQQAIRAGLGFTLPNFIAEVV